MDDLINKIKLATTTRSLNFMESGAEGDEKPVCIILDEIDAFIQSNFLNSDKLMKFLYS